MPSPPFPFIKDISRIYFKRKSLSYRNGRVESFFQLNIDVEVDIFRFVVSWVHK